MKKAFINTLASLGMAVMHLTSSAGSLAPVSYGAGYNSDAGSFDFFIRFDRAPDFFDEGGNRIDDMQYWLNSMYGVNAFHTAMEMHLPKEMQLGTTSMLFIANDSTMALVRLDGASPPLFGWRGTLVRELPFTVSPDHTLRFSVLQSDLADVDGGISAVFETYRAGETPSGMYIQQIPEPASIWMFVIGLLLVTSKKLKRPFRKAVSSFGERHKRANAYSA